VRKDDGADTVSLSVFGMQMRAKHVGGCVEVKTLTGGGSEIRADFPLHTGIVETESARRISNAA
jgi:hypothetical protein